MIEMNDEILQRNATVVDNIMAGVVDMLEQATEKKEVLYVAEAGDYDVFDDEKKQSIINLAEECASLNPYVQNVYIYLNKNGLIIDKKNARSEKEIARKDKWYYIYKSISVETSYVLVNDSDSIYVCRQLYSDAGIRCGIIVFEVGLQIIRNVLETEGAEQKGTFFMQDMGGQILYCSSLDFYSFSQTEQKDFVDMITNAMETVQEKPYCGNIISVRESIHQIWKYALVTAIDMYEEEVSKNRGFLYGVLLFGVIVSIVSAGFVTYITYRPIRKIIDVIERPQDIMESHVNNKQSYELVYIIGNIINVNRLKRKADIELNERMWSLRRAQLSALQFQMNPHFLYNTLETIKWCSIEDMGIGNRTGKAIARLARMYRFCMNDENIMLTLQEELEFTKLYIDVMRIRFGEKIQYEWNVEENLGQCSVIKMCIQPVVENAINHGLKKKLYCGNITISAYRYHDKIHLAVEDDGVGLTSGEIMRMNQLYQEGNWKQSYGVGLGNVNKRIQLIYGEDYGVRVSRAEKYEKGIRVNIILPYIENAEEEKNGV